MKRPSKVGMDSLIEDDLAEQINQAADQQPQQEKEDKPIKKHFVEVDKVEDVFDTILNDSSLDLVKIYIMNQEIIETSYLRTAKLLNFAVHRVQQLLNIEESEKQAIFNSNKTIDNLEILSEIIDLSLRYAAVFSRHAGAYLSNDYQITINKPFTKQLMNFIVSSIPARNTGYYSSTQILPLVLEISLKKLLIFCLNIPAPFVCTGDGNVGGDVFLNGIVSPLFDELTYNPNAQHFEILTLALFACPERMHKRLLSHIRSYKTYLESSLEVFESSQHQLNSFDCLCMTSVAKLLLFAAVTNSQILTILNDDQLPRSMYKLIYSKYKFSGKEEVLNRPTQELISIIILLNQVLLGQVKSSKLGKDFIQTLIGDLRTLAREKSLIVISTVILPMLSASNLELVAACISKDWSLDQIEQEFEYLESASKEQLAHVISSDSEGLASALLKHREWLQVNSIVRQSMNLDTPINLNWEKTFEMKADNSDINQQSKSKLYQAITGQKGILFILELASEIQSGENIKLAVYLNGEQKFNDFKNLTKSRGVSMTFLLHVSQQKEHISELSSGRVGEEYLCFDQFYFICVDILGKYDGSMFPNPNQPKIVQQHSSHFYLRMEGPMIGYQQSNKRDFGLEIIEGVVKSGNDSGSISNIVGTQEKLVYNTSVFSQKGDSITFYTCDNIKIMKIRFGKIRQQVNPYYNNNNSQQKKQNVNKVSHQKLQWKQYSQNNMYGQMIPQGMKLDKIEVWEVSHSDIPEELLSDAELAQVAANRGSKQPNSEKKSKSDTLKEKEKQNNITFESLFNDYFKYVKDEKIAFLPNFSSLRDVQDKFIRTDFKNKVSLKPAESHSFEEKIELDIPINKIIKTHTNSMKNNILNLLVNPELDLKSLDYSKKFSEIYPQCEDEKFWVEEKVENVNAELQKVLEFFQMEVKSEEQMMELLVFLIQTETICKIPGVSMNLLRSPSFFLHIFDLISEMKTAAGTTAGMLHFHSATHLLLKSLRLALTFKQDETKRFLVDNFWILEKILVNFENYNGRNQTQKLIEANSSTSSENPAANQASADTSSYPIGGIKVKSGLSSRGIGYGSGSSDMSWVNQQQGMLEVNDLEDPSYYNQNKGYPNINQNQNQNSYFPFNPNQNLNQNRAFAKPKKIKIQDQFNAYSAIHMYLDQDLIMNIGSELIESLAMLFQPAILPKIDFSLYEKIKKSSLHDQVIHYMISKNLVLETGPTQQSRKMLSLLKNIASIHGIEDFLIWGTLKQSAYEQLQKLKQQQEKMQIEGDSNAQEQQQQIMPDYELGKVICIYQRLTVLRQQLLFFLKISKGVPFGSVSVGFISKISENTIIAEELLQDIDYITNKLVKAGFIEIREEIIENPEKDWQSQIGQRAAIGEVPKSEKPDENLSEYVPILLQAKCVQRSNLVSNNHHYKQQITSLGSYMPTVMQMQRFAQEISGLQSMLEARASSAIFVATDEERFNIMRAVIFGSEGTPYAHGAFVYDIFLPQQYPQQSPMMNLTTTGNGKIRFNPNLYHCGKVCLSLLGTWRGSSSESWNPKISSISQLLISVQAIVMSDHVYFNEPGYEGSANTKDGEELNVGYSNIVRLGNIRYAMIEQLRDPMPEFQEIILTNFYLKRTMILAECQKWVDQADAPCKYTGLVSSHNQSYEAEIKQKGYKKLLEKEIEILKQEFEKLKLNMNLSLEPSLSASTNPNEKSDSKKPMKIVTILKHSKPSLSSSSSSSNNLPSLVLQKKSSQSIRREMEIEEEKQKESKKEIQKMILEFSSESKKEKNSNFKGHLSTKKGSGMKAEEECPFASLDAGVQDRWSRYIGVLGLDSVRKQAEASVLIIGLNHIGIEIAKNIALSGVKLLGLNQQEPIKKRPFSRLGQFSLPSDFKCSFFSEQTVIESTLKRIQALNEYVQCVEEVVFPESNDMIQESAQKYTTVVMVNQSFSFQLKMSEACRKFGTAFIAVDQASVYVRVINAFGNNFTVLDPTGEPTSEFMINRIEQNESEDFEGLVTVHLTKGSRHSLVAGSEIVLREVIEQGGDGFTSWNQKRFVVMDPIHKESFTINVSNVVSSSGAPMAGYLRNGIASEQKIPMTLNHSTFFDQQLNPVFDEGMSGNTSLEHKRVIHLAFLTLLNYKQDFQQSLPEQWDLDCAEDFFLRFRQLFRDLIAESKIPCDYLDQATLDSKHKNTILLFAMTCKGFVPAQGSVVGGVVAQEVIKSITQKWKPINQTWIHNCEELLQIDPKLNEIDILKIPQKLEYGLLDVTYPLYIIIGSEGIKTLAKANPFIVGAGAIGCELMKNLAMNGFAVGGSSQITITDPDLIENSNLSRQFLFNTKHIGKSKAYVSAAAAITMNKELLNHIEAKQLKVFDGSEHIFSDSFFEKQSIVLNALDNVEARKYVDRRCVKARVKMIDSGTLGSKGHVQVVVPSVTESYGDKDDPLEEGGGEIPVCTLKMFPENSVHCMEWAKDKFGRTFNQKISSLQRMLEGLSTGTYASLEEKVIREALACLRKIPRSFKDCLEYAVHKFHKLFYLNVKQLLHVYPLEHKLADGSHFWTLPKRPPVPLAFTPENTTYAAFVIAFAKIRANIFGISYQNNDRVNKEELCKLTEFIKLREFQANEDKAKAMQDEIKKDQEKQNKQNQEFNQMDSEEQNPIQIVSEDSKENLIEKVKGIASNLNLPHRNFVLNPQEFEKDNDANFHVDFLHAMTNCRGENYRLEPMERIDVKIKAGRITPALVTTTAIVAGLQTIEAMKLLLDKKVDQLQNSFVNISLPSIVQSEPFNAYVHSIGPVLKFSSWDRLSIVINEHTSTIESLYHHLRVIYKIFPRNMFQGSRAVYLEALYSNNPSSIVEHKKILSTPLFSLLSRKSFNDTSAEVVISFSTSETSDPYEAAPVFVLNF